MGNDTITKTLIVAGLLSIVCSVIVSTAAISLKSKQVTNKDLDRKQNILMAAGLLEEDKPIEELFAKFEPKLVDLATGEYNDDIPLESFDQRKAAKSQEDGVDILEDLDLASIKRRSKYALVYMARGEEGRLQQLILPVHGKGLWSTLYGFLALDSDLTSINGFAFYEHGETPGLGGEVDNPLWKAQWIGKKAFDENWNVRIEVLKGKVNSNDQNIQYRVDGLSGATITSRGVRDLLKYWLGENGFKPFLERLRASEMMDQK